MPLSRARPAGTGSAVAIRGGDDEAMAKQCRCRWLFHLVGALAAFGAGGCASWACSSVWGRAPVLQGALHDAEQACAVRAAWTGAAPGQRAAPAMGGCGMRCAVEAWCAPDPVPSDDSLTRASYARLGPHAPLGVPVCCGVSGGTTASPAGPADADSWHGLAARSVLSYCSTACAVGPEPGPWWSLAPSPAVPPICSTILF
jgi:hypothetical protein